MSFADLGLSEEVLKAVFDAGYSDPTPIQEGAIPYVLMGRDILGCAQTGTGKTASFTLPMIDILASGRARARMPRTLILEPTRELAAQVAENFDSYGKYHNLTKALIIGGTSMDEQTRVLDKGVDVLIATPGRLLDLFDRGGMLLNDVKILVIDEADHAGYGVHSRCRKNCLSFKQDPTDPVFLRNNASRNQAACRFFFNKSQRNHCGASGNAVPAYRTKASHGPASK